MTDYLRHLLPTLSLLVAAWTAGPAAAEGTVGPAGAELATMCNSQLPVLGQDKWGQPIYHPMERTRTVRTTAYTHSESDHLRYGARNAIGGRLLYTDKLRSAAADWSVYPVGTKFRIKGLPYTYVVDDYGGALVGTGTIDIYQPSKSLMRSWGTRVVEIEIIEWGSMERSLRILAARKGSKHCKRMYAALEARSDSAS